MLAHWWCQNVKHLDYGGDSEKKELDIMRFKLYEVKF